MCTNLFLRPSRAPVAVEPLERRQLLAVISGFSQSLVVGGMTRPVQMDFAPDGRLFITQQDGKLRIVKNGQLLSTPFVTVPTHNTGERGLLGITLDPNFNSNKYVYAYYTRPDGSGGYRNRVSRFTANGDVAVSGSETVLFETEMLGSGTWHNSGGMRFGTDGKLYVGIGDNQQNAVAQSLTSSFGKVIRINSDGSIPSDNPFYNQVSGRYRAIWAYGFRNPFTLDVQPGTGRIFVNDVGAANWEEINELQKGANYGWPSAEGSSSNTAFKNPFYAYAHAGGENDDSAITGAAFYNPPNASFPSSYVGDFFFGDFGTGEIRRIDLSTKVVSNFASGLSEVTDVEIADDGSLYFLSRTSGQLYRIRATTSSAPTISVPPQDATVAVGQPVTFTVVANGSGLSYQWQRNRSNIAGATSSSFHIADAELGENGDAFRVIVTNAAGSVTSAEATLTVLDDQPPTATITLPTTNTLWAGGGELSFAGTGFDDEDGSLPASAFTWSIDLHHDTHAHPFVAPYSGVKSDTVEISRVGHDAEHNLFYRIHLTVRDSMGLEHSTFKDVFPQKANLSLATEPAGLSLNLDGAPVTTPYTSPAIVGFERTLWAPATQVLGGVTYAFDGWSDGGAATHDVIMPSSNVTYTARYVVSEQTTTTLRSTADAFVRDGSHANTNFGAAAELQAKTDGVGWNRHTYLQFDLTGIGADVTSAKLRLFARLDNTQAASVAASVYGGPTGWFESAITWNNKPASSATALRSFTTTGTIGKWYEIDVTNYVRDQKSFGAMALGLVLKAASAKSTIIIASDEAAANRPELVVQTGAGPGPNPGPTLFRATADAYVRGGTYASSNFGSAAELQIKQHTSLSYTRETYLMFDLSTVTTISSAKLRLYGGLTESATVQTGVYLGESTWSESGLTWNTRPSAGTTPAATTTVSGTTRQWYEWDLTSLLQSEKEAGRHIVTLVLKNLSQTNATLTFASDEASANRPELIIN